MARSDRLVAALLFGGALALYLGWGLAFDRYAPEIFRDNDRAFDADTPNRIICLTRAEGAHYLTRLHPLFVLLLNPLGLALRSVLEVGGVARPGRVAALGLTAAAGSLAVALLFSLLRRHGLDRVAALLWAALYSVSATALFFGAVPETFVFSSASLLFFLVAFFRPRRSEPLRLVASVAAFGMAITNLAMIVAARVVERPREAGKRLALRLLLVLLVAAVLSVLQVRLYPRTVLFFARGGVPSDDLRNFLRPQSASEVAGRAGEVLAHFFLANFVAPRVEVMGEGTGRTAVGFGALRWRAPGLAFGAVWLGLLGVSLARGARLRRDPLARSLVAWLAMHLVLHFAFGVQLFLYSPQWTFAVVVLAALAGPGLPPRLLRLLLGLLAVLGAANNTAFLREVLAAFG